jgi:hypothetical protein
MLDENTSWPRLYVAAALIGAGAGLLLALNWLPYAPQWPEEWGIGSRSVLTLVVLPIAGGGLAGVLLAAAAHLGVRRQLNRRARRSDDR